MFINGQMTCYESVRGSFLIVFCGSDDQYQAIKDDKPYRYDRLWCCVRFTVLRQMGHWMMGSARLGKYKVTLSGGFGSDGLPHDWRLKPLRPRINHAVGFSGIPPYLPPSAVAILKRRYLMPMPEELSTRYWQSGGHNEVGPASEVIRMWATKNELKLREVRRA